MMKFPQLFVLSLRLIASLILGQLCRWLHVNFLLIWVQSWNDLYNTSSKNWMNMENVQSKEINRIKQIVIANVVKTPQNPLFMIPHCLAGSLSTSVFFHDCTWNFSLNFDRWSVNETQAIWFQHIQLKRIWISWFSIEGNGFLWLVLHENLLAPKEPFWCTVDN